MIVDDNRWKAVCLLQETPAEQDELPTTGLGYTLIAGLIFAYRRGLLKKTPAEQDVLCLRTAQISIKSYFVTLRLAGVS